jgi:hypothetical protein
VKVSTDNTWKLTKRRIFSVMTGHLQLMIFY